MKKTNLTLVKSAIAIGLLFALPSNAFGQNTAEEKALEIAKNRLGSFEQSEKNAKEGSNISNSESREVAKELSKTLGKDADSQQQSNEGES